MADTSSPTTQALKDAQAQSQDLYPLIAKWAKTLDEQMRKLDVEQRAADIAAHTALKNSNQDAAPENEFGAYNKAADAKVRLHERTEAAKYIQIRLRNMMDAMRDIKIMAATTLDSQSTAGK